MQARTDHGNSPEPEPLPIPHWHIKSWYPRTGETILGYGYATEREAKTRLREMVMIMRQTGWAVVAMEGGAFRASYPDSYGMSEHSLSLLSCKKPLCMTEP